MRLATLVFSASLLSLPALPALGEPRPAPRTAPAPDARRMVTEDCALARKAGKPCELSIPAEDVGGATPGPGEINIRTLRPGTEPSLIRIRRDFVLEIVKSAEDL